GRDASPVILDSDLDLVPGTLRANLYRWRCGVGALHNALMDGIKGVAQQVQKDPPNVLRNDVHRRKGWVVSSFDRAFELGYPCAHAVVGEVDRFVEQAVQVNRSAFARRASRAP